jgi:tetratricopeptide (TPR) repeat protein
VGRRPEEAQERLKEAIRHLQSAEDVLAGAGMGSERLLPIYSELGRTYRDMGNLLKRQGEGEEALRNYHEARRMFERVLSWERPVVERANILEDLAETLYMAGDEAGANSVVQEAEKLIGPEYRIIPGERLPADGLPTQGFSPLGKIELLRGQMAFGHNRFEEGIQRFLLAYAYFRHFSPEAVEVDTLIRYLYGRLQRLPAPELRSLMDLVHQIVSEQDFGVDVRSYASILEDLLGT